MRSIVVFLVYCPMDSTEQIYILTQENQPAKDIDLTCFKTFPIKATTCLQVGPMSLDWPMDPIARFDQFRPSSSPEDPNDEHPENTLPASTRSRWRRDALQPPQVLHGIAGRDTCGHFPDGGLRCVTWNTEGLVGSVQRDRESSSSTISRSTLTTTTARSSDCERSFRNGAYHEAFT